MSKRFDTLKFKTKVGIFSRKLVPVPKGVVHSATKHIVNESTAKLCLPLLDRDTSDNKFWGPAISAAVYLLIPLLLTTYINSIPA